MAESDYIGRFAPTPSGPLHFGSVIAALGSYLQAKYHKGKWLVRIEDIDQPRVRFGADKLILEQLEKLGLHWDGEIVYQNTRLELYENALKKLKSLNYCFPCTCSRKETANKPYPGTCRNGIKNKKKNQSIRLKTNGEEIAFADLLQGTYAQILEKEIGDFVIKRTDGLFAYHLAVVIDDAEQNITEIVRGVDLIDSTPRQIYLQKLLKLETPNYFHLPIAIDESGNKISKQADAKAINSNTATKTLFHALEFLGQLPPIEANDSDKESLIKWAIQNWNINSLPRKKEILVATP